jgi:hypothetical protein
MSDALHLTIKPSLLDRSRKLTISPDYLEFDNRSSVGLEPTRFEKKDINGLRYGIKPIEGYQFVIGRIYCIDICNKEGQTIKLRLKSLYGVRKLQLARKYSEIVNILLDFFFDDIAKVLLGKFNRGDSFTILDVTFCAEGVQLSKDAQLITWDDLGTKSYFRYYTMYSKANANHYKVFEYLVDWNASTLYSVSRQILKDKGYWGEEK